MNNTGKIAVGVLAGLAAGTVLGVLFAPDKGERTRRKIKDSAEDFSDDFKVKMDELVSGVKKKAGLVTEFVNTFGSKEKEAKVMSKNGAFDYPDL